MATERSKRLLSLKQRKDIKQEQLSTMVNGNDKKEQENNCVTDMVQSEYFKRPKSPELLSRCSVCQKNLSHMNIERRNQHHNKCLDKQEETAKVETTVKPKDSEQVNLSACPLCKKCIQSNRKAPHLKACGAKHNLSTEKVLECLKVWQRHDDEYSTLGLAIPVNGQNQPKRKTSVKLGPKSEQDYQLQLAKAMSASLEEEKNREKEMAFRLLEGDEMIELTYSNKITQRKKKNTKKKTMPEPILIRRTEEERQKILSEKVADVISSSVDEYSAEDSRFLAKIIGNNQIDEPKCRRDILKVDDHTLGIKIDKLWYLSGYSEYEEKEAFYVSILKEFIAPTTTIIGNNLKDYADIPGRECSQRPTDEKNSEKEEEDLNLDHSEEEMCPTQFALMDLGSDSPLNDSIDNLEINDNEEKLSGEEEVIHDGNKATSTIDKTAAEKSTVLFNQDTEEIISSKKLQVDMFLMVGNPVLSDVEIKIQNGSTIPAHCFVIYSRCPEMYKEIKKTEDTLNLSSDYIDFSSFSKNAVLAFLHYLYSATVTEVKEVEEVIELSKRYKVDDLLKALTSEMPENNKMETSENPHCVEESSINSSKGCIQMETIDDDHKSNSPIFESSFHHRLSLKDDSSALDESNDNEMEMLLPLAETCDNVYFENLSPSSDHSQENSQEDASKDRIHSDKEENYSIETKSNDDDINVFENSLDSNCFTISTSNQKILEKTDNDNLEISVDILQKSKNSNSVNSDSGSEKKCFSDIVNSDSIFEKENSDNKIPYLISENGDPPIKINSDTVKESESNQMNQSDCAEKDQDSQLSTAEFKNSFCDLFSCNNNETEENTGFVSNSTSDLNTAKEDCSSKLFLSRRVVVESRTVLSEDDLDSPVLFNEEDAKKQKSSVFDFDIQQAQVESNFSPSKLRETDSVCNHEASTSTPKQLSRTEVHIPGYRFSVSPIEQLSDKVPLRPKNRIVSEDYLLSPELDKEHNSEADCESPVFHCGSYYNGPLKKASETNSDSSLIEEIQPGKIGSCIEEKSGSNINLHTLNSYVEETINKKDITKSPSAFQKDEVTDVINVSDNCSFLQNDKEVDDIKSSVNLSESDQQQNQHFISVDENSVEFTVENVIPETESSFKPTVDHPSQKEKEDDKEICDIPSLDSSFISEDVDGISQKAPVALDEGSDKDLMLVLESDGIEEQKLKQKKPPRKTRGKNRHGNTRKKMLQSTAKKSKQAPITPMPNYESIATPEVKKELKKYGIRGLPKKKGIEYLKYIYEGTHPLVTDDDASFECKSSDTQQLNNVSSIVQEMTAHSSQKNDHDISSSSSDSSYEDEILEESLFKNFKNCRKMSASQRIKNEEAKTVIREFLTSRNDFLERILLYEPFHVDELNTDFEAAGLKIKIENIIEFLDEECITFSMAKDSWSKRRRKRRSKQKSPIKKTQTKKRKV